MGPACRGCAKLLRGVPVTPRSRAARVGRGVLTCPAATRHGTAGRLCKRHKDLLLPLRSLRRPRAVALAAAASSAALALPASNALAGVPTALRATGLAEPAGTIVDPSGHTWV